MTRILKAGILYFVAVFVAGFVLGLVRTFWAVPRFGERIAELLEAPIMFVVIILAARGVAQRLRIVSAWPQRLGCGFVALFLLLVAESAVVLGLRGMTFAEYFSSRDPVAGTVYIVMLGVFAIMPLLVARK
jgi:hypothetical protein